MSAKTVNITAHCRCFCVVMPFVHLDEHLPLSSKTKNLIHIEDLVLLGCDALSQD